MAMSKFFELTENTLQHRRSSMSSQSFQAVRRLQDAGSSLPLVVKNPAWQALMDKVDCNINERSALLQDILTKLPPGKRLLGNTTESTDSDSKRQRIAGGVSELDMRKQALLAKIENIHSTAPADDSYEAYRQQCWIQYYEWVEQQKGVQSTVSEPVPSGVDEDEEIHKALLGLS